jgi:predicted nucleic acid-binding protein
VSQLILLDSGPLGLVTNPREGDQSRRCNEWLWLVLDGGSRVMVPEIADYEVRRDLTRAGRPKGIARLDLLAEQLGSLPVTTAVWRRAAELWARARTEGDPTAADAALDADVILAAQAQLAAEDAFEVIVVTTNVGHPGRFVAARPWESVTA